MVCNRNYRRFDNNCSVYFDQTSTQYQFCQSCVDNGIWDPNSFKVGGFCYSLLSSVQETDFVNYGKVKSWMQDVFSQFYKNGCQIVSSQDNDLYHPVQPELYNVCYDFKNICSYALGGTTPESFSVCKNNNFISEQYRKSDLSLNKNLAYFCGCYLQNSNYISSVPIECDSVCGATEAIKLYDSSNRQIKCQSSICTISDITLNIYESTFGTINFNQICGGVCGDISCNKCYLENVTIDVLNSKVGDINLVQKCGGTTADPYSGFQCWNIDQAGNYVQVSCETNQNSNFNINVTIFISVIVFIGVVILLLIIFLIIKNRSVKVTNMGDISNYKILSK